MSSSTAEATVEFTAAEAVRREPPRPPAGAGMALDEHTELIFDTPAQIPEWEGWQARRERLAQAQAQAQAHSVNLSWSERLQRHAALLRWASFSSLLFVAAGWAAWQWLQADSHQTLGRQLLDPQQMERLLPASADATAPLAAAAPLALSAGMPRLRLQLDWRARGGQPQPISD